MPVQRRGVLIAGGGTAGHLVPGLAVAEALTERGWPRGEIHFVGSARGMDSDMVPPAGYGLTALGGRGLNARRLNGSNAIAAASLVWATLRGVALVARRRPAAVLSMGGYAALPAAVGAVVWRVPLVIAEQNAVASGTNRLLRRFAKAAAVPVEGTGLRREVVTGNPVRPEVVNAARNAADAREQLGWPPTATVIVAFGGSLGSGRINTAVWGALDELFRRDAVMLYHVVGKRDWEQRPPPPPIRTSEAVVRDWYRAVRFDEHLPLALAAADLVICRAGASTIAELSVLGTRALLVPLPAATKNHQYRNAASLVDAGAARIVPDAELDANLLLVEIDMASNLGDNTPSNDEMPHKSTFGRPDSARRVADLIIEHSSMVPPTISPPETETLEEPGY